MRKAVWRKRAKDLEGPFERVRDGPAQTFYPSGIYQPHAYSALHLNVPRTILGIQR